MAMTTYKKFKLAGYLAISTSLALLPAFANAAPATPTYEAKVTVNALKQGQHPAYNKLATATENMLQELEQNNADDPDVIRSIFQKHVEPHVNYRFITAMILGNKHLKRTSKADFAELADLLKSEFAVSFTSALGYLADNNVSFAPLAPDENSKVAKVKLTITQNGGPDIDVNFSLRRSSKDAWNEEDSWTIYDVTAEGISMLSSYQSQYRSILNKSATTGLIELLKEKQGISSVATPSIHKPKV